MGSPRSQSHESLGVGHPRGRDDDRADRPNRAYVARPPERARLGPRNARCRRDVDALESEVSTSPWRRMRLRRDAQHLIPIDEEHLISPLDRRPRETPGRRSSSPPFGRVVTDSLDGERRRRTVVRRVNKRPSSDVLDVQADGAPPLCRSGGSLLRPISPRRPHGLVA